MDGFNITPPLATKFFEIRDHMTCMPAIGIKMSRKDRNPSERFLLGNAGYGPGGRDLILLVFIGINQCHYDPHQWGAGDRTRYNAHKYIQDNFDTLESGQVIDVEFIIGETRVPKKSDTFFNWDTGKVD